MKSKFIVGFALALTWFLTGCSTTAKHQSGVALGSTNDLSVSIALLQPSHGKYRVNISTNDHFHVVISNNSSRSQRVIMEECSWGHGALSFEMTDSLGKKYRVQRQGADWTDNGLVYWILKPSEHYVREVCFGQIYQGRHSWVGLPENHQGYLTVEMKAVFELNLEKDDEDRELWHGRIESVPITCVLYKAH